MARAIPLPLHPGRFHDFGDARLFARGVLRKRVGFIDRIERHITLTRLATKNAILASCGRAVIAGF